VYFLAKMKPSQNLKDQGVSPYTKEVISPNYFPRPQIGERSDPSKITPSSQVKDQTDFETNIPYTHNPAQSSYSDEFHQEGFIEGQEEEGLAQEDKLRSYADTEEDPEIKSRKKNFSQREIDEDDEDQDKEGSERNERTPTNFVSL